MFRKMTRDDSAFDIRGTTGSEVDHEVYVLSLIKCTLRRLSDRGKQDPTHEHD